MKYSKKCVHLEQFHQRRNKCKHWNAPGLIKLPIIEREINSSIEFNRIEKILQLRLSAHEKNAKI